MNELADKIENLNNDTEFVYKLDARERAEREQKARMTAAIEKGLKEGLEKGIKQGREKGLKEGREKGLKEGKKEGSMEKAKEIAKKLKQMNMRASEIEEATGLTKEEIESL